MVKVLECEVCGIATVNKTLCYPCAYDLATGKTREEARKARHQEMAAASKKAVERALRPTYEQLQERIRQLEAAQNEKEMS